MVVDMDTVTRFRAVMIMNEGATVVAVEGYIDPAVATGEALRDRLYQIGYAWVYETPEGQRALLDNAGTLYLYDILTATDDPSRLIPDAFLARNGVRIARPYGMLPEGEIATLYDVDEDDGLMYTCEDLRHLAKDGYATLHYPEDMHAWWTRIHADFAVAHGYMPAY